MLRYIFVRRNLHKLAISCLPTLCPALIHFGYTACCYVLHKKYLWLHSNQESVGIIFRLAPSSPDSRDLARPQIFQSAPFTYCPNKSCSQTCVYYAFKSFNSDWPWEQREKCRKKKKFAHKTRRVSQMPNLTDFNRFGHLVTMTPMNEIGKLGHSTGSTNYQISDEDERPFSPTEIASRSRSRLQINSRFSWQLVSRDEKDGHACHLDSTQSRKWFIVVLSLITSKLGSAFARIVSLQVHLSRSPASVLFTVAVACWVVCDLWCNYHQISNTTWLSPCPKAAPATLHGVRSTT